MSTDYIGPPDAKSNLRPYIRHYDDTETEMAKKLRLLRIEVENWNMDFWTKHNKRFYEVCICVWYLWGIFNTCWQETPHTLVLSLPLSLSLFLSECFSLSLFHVANEEQNQNWIFFAILSNLFILFLLQEKEDFIRLHKLNGTDEISADQMSVFYKSFLDKNRRMHMMYNLSWYLKNFDMLTLAFAVQVQKTLSRLRRKPLTEGQEEANQNNTRK